MSVKFIARSDTFYGMLHNLAKSFPEENKFLDQWVFVLDPRVFVLDHRVFVLDHRVFVLDHKGLRFWVFVLDTSPDGFLKMVNN